MRRVPLGGAVISLVIYLSNSSADLKIRAVGSILSTKCLERIDWRYFPLVGKLFESLNSQTIVTLQFKQLNL